MAKLALVAMLIFLFFKTIPWVQSIEDGPNKLNWATRVDSGKEVVTNLQFYFHDTLSGKNPSAMRVAEASNYTDNSWTLFGAVMMADDPLTEGPDPASKLVGRAQGLYGSAGQEELSLIMAMNYGFKDGMYNGSSISIVGINRALHPVREMAIVGGTGLFRMARGYAIAETHWFDPTSGDAIVWYNVTVIT
ncbi:dirigent protein 23-like [Cornus florida]|uniref:dirigent protein 23-like n=1 Tax=Cornus florida TaxID=4283 RepID=UPI00289FCFD8|nr:dirigent protein 23-like [Cornus florida]